jgi:hypothetical protein
MDQKERKNNNLERRSDAIRSNTALANLPTAARGKRTLPSQKQWRWRLFQAPATCDRIFSKLRTCDTTSRTGRRLKVSVTDCVAQNSTDHDNGGSGKKSPDLRASRDGELVNQGF